ncbi:hypothetical protein Rsub_12496 [Raphidocelis subcapitata]|uniref:RING-type E3 ubiquitin transferase n=1 Tax=Raphidocelis subcapitata TaxID=307507 RepID=A0A2V0PJG1_9CHLO|nr:hypothetical protein Rsub_12496 [Raphidocelis subcapitata]|eukprot:GBF99856.1 hypothetical protein Rsub_12496 [Raphidocelis subcapitata]
MGSASSRPHGSGGRPAAAAPAYEPPQHVVPRPSQQQPAPPPTAEASSTGRGRPAADRYAQTSTVKNPCNLRKGSLRVAPAAAGRPGEFELQFAFDATAPCRVTTFLLVTEDPSKGCSLASALLGAPPRQPVAYESGPGLQFPPPGGCAAAASHAVDLATTPLSHMTLASGNSYPIVIRLEALSEAARAEGRSLDELPPGAPLPAWVRAQSTYARLAPGGADGALKVEVLKQTVWANGARYELREIYGMRGGGDEGPGDLEAGDCVICLCEERSAMVLPCRHMCLCRDCAVALKTRTNKCPVCRNPIQSLLHLTINRRPPSPPAAVAGGGTPVAVR